MILSIRALAFAAAAGALATSAFAQTANETGTKTSQAGNASPIYGVTIPPNYRDWKVVSVSEVEGKVHQLRVQLANDIAIKAFRDGTRPFPEGSIVVAAHWNTEVPEGNNKVLAGVGFRSTIAGSPANVQFMVKDSKKYPATAGWGFGDFTGGKPGDEALHRACFSCHAPAKDRDYVYTHYVATP
jgi:Cytochrome P460